MEAILLESQSYKDRASGLDKELNDTKSNLKQEM